MAEEEASREQNIHPCNVGALENDGTPQATQIQSCRTQFKFLIEGEVYTALHRHFLMQGKGRRPQLPPTDKMTNGLLLQLFFLKEEAHASYKEVRTWLQKLIPSTGGVSESQICHRVNTIFDLCSQLPDDEVRTLLQTEHNFHPLPPALISLGINNLDPSSYTKNPLENVRNEVVIVLSHLASKENRPPIFVRRWLVKLSLACAEVSESRLRTCVTNALSIHKQLTKKRKTDELRAFMCSPFNVEKTESKCKEVKKEKVNENTAGSVEKNLIPKTTVHDMGVEVSMKCLFCERLETENNEQQNQITNLREKIITLESNLALSKKRESKMRAQIDEVCQTQLYYKRNIALKKTTEELQSRITELEENLEHANSVITENVKKHKDLKRKLKSEQTLKSNYKKAKFELKEEKENMVYALNALQEETTLKENHHNLYSNNVRKLYIALQGEANVTSTSATKVVRLVSKHLFNKDFTEQELPCPKTCLNFMDEAHHIAKQQIVEKILDSHHYTYASDGTGREKQHFMEHHIVLDDGSSLSMGYSEVPNDTADTLLEKSLDLFDELTDIHCDANNAVDRNNIFTLILSKLRCLMSDRAANMKLFNKKMLEFKKDLIGQDATIEFLHCNAHFLIALSDATEKAAKAVELPLGKLGRDNDSTFSRFSSSEETAACRVIRLTANVLGPRGDEKNGCRQEWLAYCDSSGVKSTFTSYRSNRFNNLFENAIGLLSHKVETLHFIEECVSHSNQLLKSICLDHHDSKLISIVVGIALFATYITCPYWNLMNSNTSYGQFPAHVKSMKSALEKWSADDFDVENLPHEEPVFGNKFKHWSTVAHEFLSSNCDRELASAAFKLICKNSHEVLIRQLSDFLDGGVYGGILPKDIQELLDSCPLTNLTGERLFGDLDYDMTKRRTASTYLRSTISMLKHNNTSAFLDDQTPSQLDSIMSSGRKQGKKLKAKHKAASKRAREALKAKLKENERRKKEKELQEIERRAAIMTDVIAQGGICHTKDDLDELMKKPQRMQNLKIQIRFYKYIMNASDLRLTGNYDTLYAGLCNHLSPSDELITTSDTDGEMSDLSDYELELDDSV